MNRDFPRLITFLRKERKLSQKQAAQELGISQALLSHYEKGIRECGLDFVVKAADYYNVSCDYLLGRTADREYDLRDTETDNASSATQTTAQIINRRLLSSILNAIYDFIAASKNRRLDRTVTNYLMISVYRVFRRLYSCNKENTQEFFTVPFDIYDGYADAAMTKLYTDFGSMTSCDSPGFIKTLGAEQVSPERIAEAYPESASEIFNVIQQAENHISKL